jgi:hypothetical protein
VWGNKTLVVNNFNAMPSKGTLLLDIENSTVHVLFKDGAVTTNGLMGQTFITQASMNNPAFNTPCLILDTSDDDTAISTSNPTSTKQNLNATTDLVVAGSTGRGGNRIISNTVDLTPNVLTLFSISPAEVTAGEASFTLTATGKLFSTNAGIRINGSTTGISNVQVVNSGRITATIASSRISTAGTLAVTVRNTNPTLDSNAKNLVVTATHPVPTVGLVSPNRATVGSGQNTISLFGTGFRRSSVVRFNGSNRTTQFISDTQLTATLPASDKLVPGPYPITVFNPTPGGGSSTPTAVTTFYVTPSCTPPTGQSLAGITLFNTVKHQMWYNDAQWWGAFSDNVGGIYFYKQNGSNFTKGALLDNNFNGRPDVLWNGTHLFVLVYEFNTLARLYKFSYNTTNDTYTLLTGFPVNIPLIGIGPGVSAAETGSITLAEDSTGKLWAAYPGSFIGGDGNYRVIWSTSADHRTWNTNGFIFDTGADVGTQEVAPIVHFGGDKVGIIYSRQPTKEVLFRYHVDGDPETTWSTTEIVDSGLGHLGIGGVADNHMSVKAAPDGRIFVAAKDSDGAGFINLYVRSAAGVWSNPVLTDVDPHAAVTRPILLLDLENSEVYVFYADATSGFMYMNKSPMANPVFGPACPYVNHLGVSDATSTRQNLKASMGMRVVGSTGGALSTLNFNPLTLVAGSANVPVLSNISPAAVGVGSGPTTITINGSNFATGAVVYFNGSDRPTTFVSSTQLTARLMASDMQAMGTFPITVMNPKGGTSAAVNLPVSAAITSLSPASTTSGGPAFTLTVNGTGFLTGAVVRFNGADRTTTFVSNGQVTAQILATDIVTAGIVPVVVVNPGGVVSPPSNFTINNPVPTVTALSPSPVIVGGAAFPLTVIGTNFVNGAVVNFNGLARTTTFVSSTQLTAQITAPDLAATGSFPITVTNPTPGGGTSAPLALAVNNPVPVISGLSPTSVSQGASGVTLTINGTGFINGSVVRFNGVDKPTGFVSATQLTAQLAAADLLTLGSFPITVFNPTPGGGLSNANNFNVDNPVPTLASINPTSKTAGDPAFTITVNGTGFINGSVVRFNGTNRTTTFVSATQLTAQITAADVQSSGTAAITVFNPTPGGGTSSPINLTINNPVPTLGTLSPTSKVVGDPAFVLTVNGTNFVNGSIVRFNGSDRTTTFVSSTQLTAQITAADLQTGGTFPITVFNPTPGGGASNAVNFDVVTILPVPVISSINPTNKVAGDVAFTLTINGTGFTSSSSVQCNGQNRATSFVSPTQLTAQIPETDIAVPGTLNVTVVNPAPGGGTSNIMPLTVATNPRTVQVVNGSGGGGATITVPVLMTAQGDENAIGFSLNFDTTYLTNPSATLGTGAAGATLNTNSSQAASGRYGLVLSLPTGQTFPAGTAQILNVTFNTAVVATQTDTVVGFGDSPVFREISDSVAQPLFTAYTPGTVTITLGYEADVAPRPNGSNTGTITISDWTQTGRFSSGLDTVNPGSEFQRADSAPRSTMGNGVITISDWVQAGRYASGLDSVIAAGGPTTASAPTPLGKDGDLTSQSLATDQTLPSTTVRLLGTELTMSGRRTISIEIDTQGNENALGFSLMFDPKKLSFVSATKGEELESAVLNVNKLEADEGRVGFGIALPAGRSFGPGTHQVVVLTFDTLSDEDTVQVGFGDNPVAREVVDVNANGVRTLFRDPATGLNPLDDVQFFVAQHYLDFLNRTPDQAGLDYWSQQIRSCGTDILCAVQRRTDVSAAFFSEKEFQQTGYVVYRLYRAAFGSRPNYAQYTTDRSQLSAQSPASRTEFIKQFVRRAEFRQAYPDSLSTEEFARRLYEAAGVSRSLAPRRNTKSRAEVLSDLIEVKEFKDREYNPAFVLMEYFGYLRRDPDQAGYDFWLNVLNNKAPGNYRGMVCSFLTSQEYQQRFSPTVSSSNQLCGQ